MAELDAGAGYKEHTTRIISGRLLVGIIFLPFICAWFLLRPGYSNLARVLGLGWGTFALLGALSVQGTEQQALNGKQSVATSEPSAKSKTQAAAPSAPAPPPEEKYLELLDILERDLLNEGLVRHEDIPQTTWAVSIEIMGNIATALEERKKYQLSSKGKARDQAFRKLVASEQAKALPLLRSIYAKSVAEKVWECDVDVEARGNSNRTLRLTGYWFAANRNIKTIMETIHEDALAMRCARVEFRSNKYDDTTYYQLKPLANTQLANFS